MFSVSAMMAPARPSWADNQEDKIGKKSIDPHDMFCSKCHVKGKQGVLEGVLLTGDDSVSLCLRCHPKANLHPIGIPPSGDSATFRDFALPLGTGPDIGKIVCLTCHYIHAESFTPNLLRAENHLLSEHRNRLCYACHRNRFDGRTPHTGKEDTCIFCHTSDPETLKGESQLSAAEIASICNFCHRTLKDTHFQYVNPFCDPEVYKRLDTMGAILKEGRITCVTCHNAHGSDTGENGRLTPAYLELATVARCVNPHWSSYLCLSCHKDKPKSGEPNLLGDGDINAVCNRCHKSKYARAEIHPVGIKPSKLISIPEDFPLQNGKLTCETCHISNLKPGAPCTHPDRRQNPNFLRRHDLSRHSFCFLCHTVETYQRLNPHENQIDQNGKIIEDRCLFCHASRPDLNILGLKNVDFIVKNPDEYCIGCHPGYNRTHPAGGYHLVKPSETVLIALKTSVERIGVELPLYNGRIICATCHNPHQEGVIKIPASAEGSQRQNKLRLMPGIMQCIGCHLDKR